jgi:DNA-binding MarR family transcriptional regulator
MFMCDSLRVVDHAGILLSITVASKPTFTEKQGQYLAFIYTYALINRCAPAESDMQRFFGVTPPSVHNMVIELERKGLIRRTPRQARSIELAVDPADLPALQPIKTTVAGY